jgi:hypothetical protein
MERDIWTDKVMKVEETEHRFLALNSGGELLIVV